MTRNEFERYANTYGADLGRWPESLHQDALALLAVDPALADSLARRAGLDAALAAQLPPVSDARLHALERRILSATAPAPALRDRLREWLAPRELAPIAAGIALALTISWLVQATRPVPEPEAVATVNPVMAMLEMDSTGLGIL
jgi:hypothetical protein